MQKPIFYALNDAVENSPFISTEEIFEKTGRNTGNLAFTYATRRLLGKNIHGFDWSSTHDKNADETLVVSCANQLGAHCDMGGQAKKIENLDMPVIALGLGAQAKSINDNPKVPQGTLDWYDAMASRSISEKPNIGLRGQHTYNYLKSIGREKSAVVLGCPSNFINIEKDLGKKIQEKEVFPPRRVAVAGGSPWVKNHQVLERSLADIVTLTKGSYITQMTLEMLKLSRGDFSSMPKDDLLKYKNFLRPQMVLPEFMLWCRQHMEMFTHIPSWIEHLRKFDFVVGNRIHGVMLALQAGVPAMCIAHDSRIVELCETMCVPYVHMEEVCKYGLNVHNLKSYYSFDAEAYDNQRRILANKFQSFFNDNGLQESAMLDEFLKG
ncbi:polysaccharide pyruvyl transferase family protein [Halomonas sp. FME65]|uniref:polysaccharide pyruvyl transferase family protein n=1 Tax=Halomonas sp. FME65 TaxID=2742614 RepID=UPI00186729B5|nr:polysaccharide pyruvyl transferase family protein [Halomonas sp. FME65]